MRGVRIKQDGKVTEIYLNLLADDSYGLRRCRSIHKRTVAVKQGDTFSIKLKAKGGQVVIFE